MIANAGPSILAGLLIYVIGFAVGAFILYLVVRAAVVSALHKHQLWLEQYRPATNPGPQPPAA